MPQAIRRELMILVERVVRPLPLPLNRQKRVRSELLDHLQIGCLPSHSWLYRQELLLFHLEGGL
jgi:hypothetical protein